MTNCDHCRTLLDDYALHPSRVSEAEWVATHLAECADCQAEWRALQEAWSQLTAPCASTDTSTESSEARSELRSLEDRIVARALNHSAEPATLLHSQPYDRGFKFAKYVVAATVLCGLSLVYYAVRQGTTYMAPEDALVTQQLHDLAAKLDRIDALKQVFASPTLRYVSLRNPASPSEAGAYLVFDQLANEGHFLAFGLPNPRPDQHLVVWLLDQDDQVMASASFELNAEKLGGTTIRFPEDPRRVTSVRVTVEKIDANASPPKTVPSTSTEYLRADVRLF